MPQIVIFGNSGSGKSTLARRCATESGCAHLDLDTVAWDSVEATPKRLSIAKSKRQIDAYLKANASWVVEGCYADLIELVLPRATEMIFLNPGTKTCIANARRRPWEPHKYASKDEQDNKLDMLIAWIQQYETRDDELSLAAHRRLYDQFRGAKRELVSNAQNGSFAAMS